MNQGELLKLVIPAVIVSSLLAAFLTVLVNNYFIGRREGEKSRRDIIDKRIKPAEDYLVNLQSLFKKVVAVACDDSLPNSLKEEFERQFFEFGTKIAVIQALKILNDDALNALINDFPKMIQDFVVKIYRVMDTRAKENEEQVIAESEALQNRIFAIHSLIDVYRLNGYRPKAEGK
jgi:hypothetical protein